MQAASFMQPIKNHQSSIAVIGLGYVGLPLACLLAKKYKVLGFDIDPHRIDELNGGYDRTREVESKDALLHANIRYSAAADDLSECRLFIVAVPTPVDAFRKPDLTPVIAASRTVAKHLKPGSVVVFESTVYPGVTEEVCGEEIAKVSGLQRGKDFFLGYSPERVNPGDKEHTIDKIVKVISGENEEVTEILAQVYGSIVTAGVHRAPNIKTAEAAKVIENTQRDLNIALVNELAMLFEKVGIDTGDVLAAAGTKWNFLKFQPGLVGGHCIGVDPYYLTYLADKLNFHTQVIHSGRRINDSMGTFIAEKTIRLIMEGGRQGKGRFRVGVLGVTFKENVPDLRNTKVMDVVDSLESFGGEVYLFDPVVNADEFTQEYHRSLTSWDDMPVCDALIMAVQHQDFFEHYPLARMATKLATDGVIVDIKRCLPRDDIAELGLRLWRL